MKGIKPITNDKGLQAVCNKGLQPLVEQYWMSDLSAGSQVRPNTEGQLLCLFVGKKIIR